MDTVTSILEGEIFGFKSNDTLPGARIELVNAENKFETESDRDGKFAFSHIESGKYILSTNYIGCRNLVSDSISLGSGNVVKVVIRMGETGQDDIKNHR